MMIALWWLARLYVAACILTAAIDVALIIALHYLAGGTDPEDRYTLVETVVMAVLWPRTWWRVAVHYMVPDE